MSLAFTHTLPLRFIRSHPLPASARNAHPRCSQPNFAHGPCSPAPPRCCSQSSSLPAGDPRTDEPVLEGDLLLVRPRATATAATGCSPVWRFAACTGSFGDSIQLCPVQARSVDDRGNWELFVEEEHVFDLAFQPLSELHVRFIDADYEMRVIEDRVINPHGEESEHCWRVDPALISALPITMRPPASVYE